MSATERALREALAERLRSTYGHRFHMVNDGTRGADEYDLSRNPLIAEAIAFLLAEPSAPSLVPKDTQGDEAQASNEGKDFAQIAWLCGNVSYPGQGEQKFLVIADDTHEHIRELCGAFPVYAKGAAISSHGTDQS